MSSIDVIVPCYRYGHFLRECVQSILAETAHDVRVLIIDDASPDNTAEVAAKLAEEDSRVTFVQHLTNKKHIATFNEGIDWVSADYMLLLSADDYLLPGALSRAVNILDSHPDVGFVFGRVILSSESGIAPPPSDVSTSDSGSGTRIMTGREFIKLLETSGGVNIVPTPSAVVRTNLQKRLGGYRMELPHSGDMEMWLRFAAHASVGQIDAYQAVYRQHGANMQLAYYSTNRQLPDLQQREAALRIFYDTCRTQLPDAEQILDSLRRLLSLDAIGHASGAFNAGETALSEQLAQFAITVYPPNKRSLRWISLLFKKSLGQRLWRTVLPWVNWVRRTKNPAESV